MALRVKCTNSACLAEFEVGDEMAGQTAQCPQCGTVTTVPTAGAPAAPQQAGTAEGAETGEGRSRAPLLIGGGIVVGLGVLGVLILVAVKLLSEREEAPAERPKAAVQKKKVAARPAPKPKQAGPAAAAAQALAALKSREEEIQQAVTEYKAQLRETLSHVGTAGREEMAERWADLYAFCVEKGLKAEAERCWQWAVRLRPTDEAVNEKLGRTEAFAGAPVTPEQKEFLEGLRPRLRLVNRHPGLGDHSVAVEGAGEAPLGWGEPVEFQLDADSALIEVGPRRDPEGLRYAFTLPLTAGLVHTVSFEHGGAPPQPPFARLAEMYGVVAEGALSPNVVLIRGPGGEPVEARFGPLRVKAEEGSRLLMQLSRDRTMFTMTGSLLYGHLHAAEGQHVLYGVSGQPVRLAVNAAEHQFEYVTGRYYNVRVELADGLWGALATAQGDLAAERARRRLADHLE
ncbi:MAG: hypothetical protein ACYS1C_06835, partial [Planctomycetota bacterium]